MQRKVLRKKKTLNVSKPRSWDAPTTKAYVKWTMGQGKDERFQEGLSSQEMGKLSELSQGYKDGK